MPRRDGPVIHLHKLPMGERLAQDGRFQEHWYEFAAALPDMANVLDVGAGSGYGGELLPLSVEYFAIDPLPLSLRVHRRSLSDCPRNSVDWALAIDVVEHVENDWRFVTGLARVARNGVFLTTPNWDITKCANPHHVREYTLEEFRSLLAGYRYEILMSTADCKIEALSVANLDRAANFGAVIYL